jgi:hypothetical protein
MIGSTLGRRIAVVFTVAALCVAAAGCAADIGITKSEGREGSGQMRYYGGPKSPMWSGQ